MIFRVLILGGLIGLAWMLWKRYMATRAPRTQQQPEFQRTVKCVTCGVHLPARDAIAGKADEHFCCPEHVPQHVKED